MRRFALGCLGYDPDRFGKMLVGDFLDAMGGYNEDAFDRFKEMAELIRLSTAKLWNIQVGLEDKLEVEELWPFPWDKKEKGVSETISEDEYKERLKRAEDFMNKVFPDGNSNNKS